MDQQTAERIARRLAEEQQAFARTLGALLRRAPVTCEAGAPLQRLAARMRDEKVGSLVVVDAASRPVGIVTSQDVVRAIAEGPAGAADKSAADVMTPQPQALPADAFAYEAAVLMRERGIRHILVEAGGRLAGVVSERDLFSLQRLALGELNMEIQLARDMRALAGLAADIRALTVRLVEQGVAALQLTLFVAVLNDRIARRVLELVRPRHDLDRLGWSWLSFGSEGRLEQTISTDQDNGLVFAAHDGAAPEAARLRLLPFAREVNEGLDACGFPLCKGDVMASNPKLCLSVEEWQAQMSGWIANTDPQALLDASICFDFRSLAGDAALAEPLRATLLARAGARPAFLRLLAGNALVTKPPLGMLGAFATSDVPEAPHSVDLKGGGARLFVDAARIFALAHGLPQTSTIERLRAAAAAGALRGDEVSAWIGAFAWLQQLRLRIQMSPAGATGGGNRIDPEALDAFERRMLKEAFRQAARLQDRLRADYQL
jgi:CBS domain-containing protein